MKDKVIKSPKFGLIHTLFTLAVWATAAILIINPEAEVTLADAQSEIFIYPVFVFAVGAGFIMQFAHTHDASRAPFFARMCFFCAVVLCFLSVILDLHFKSYLWLVPYAISALLAVVFLYFTLKNNSEKALAIPMDKYNGFKSEAGIGRLSVTVVVGQIITFVYVLAIGEMTSAVSVCIFRVLLFLPLLAAQNVIIYVSYAICKIAYGKKAPLYLWQSAVVFGLTYLTNEIFYNEIYVVMRICTLCCIYTSNLIYVNMEFFYLAIEKRFLAEKP